MKRETKKDILSFLMLSIIIGILISQMVIKAQEKHKVINMSTNTFHDMDADKSLDTITQLALNYYNLKGLEVGVRYITCDNTNIEDVKLLKGYTLSEGNKYLITIKPTSKKESIKIIAHEITHIKQLYDNKIKVTPSKVFWLNKEIINIPSYKDRPWEIEAFKNEQIIEEYILNNL